MIRSSHFLPSSLLILLAACQPTEPIPPRTEVIPGRAMPLRLNPDSTWIPIDDFVPGIQPDSVTWIPAWGKGMTMPMATMDGAQGVWIVTQPTQGFGALGIHVNGETAQVPVFASTTQRITYTLPTEYSDREDVRIMGAFNGWSRTSHPLQKGEDGQWSIGLKLPEGEHPYQLILDGIEMPDPNCPRRVDNGFGGFNSILTVAGDKRSTELSAIGFGGNQVHDVRLLGTPGARIWSWWEDRLFATVILGEDGIGNVRIPAAAYGSGRTDLRMWATSEGKPSREVRIPLLDGIPVMNSSQLTRKDWESQVMYFMLVDRFRNANPSNDRPVEDPAILPQANDHGGDLAGIRAALEDGYFEELGVTALWVSPLTRNPNAAYGLWQDSSTQVTSRFSGYHGYWPISNTEIDPRFGSREELNDLVDEAHERDMNFLLDYVANHVHEEHPLYKSHPDWATSLYLPDGTENTQLWDEQRLTTWFDTFMPTLNLEREDVAAAMSDSAAWWIAHSKIDGFRHDATKHIPLSFWRMLTRKVKGATSGTDRRIYQIGETYGSAELIGSYLGTGLLDAQFDFNLYDKAIVSFGKDDAGFADLIQVAEEGLDQYGAHHLMGTITGNQDRPRFASLAEGTVRWDEDHKLAGWTRDIQRNGIRGHQAMRMLTAFNMSMPGVPCIYQGDEYADVGGNDPDNRRMVRFDDLDAEEIRTRAMATQWIQLRRERMSLIYGRTELDEVQPQLLKITRQYLDESTIVFINASSQPVVPSGLENTTPLLGKLAAGKIPPYAAVAFSGSF